MKHISAVLLAVATFAAGSALAHTELAATVPANGAMIAKAPDNVKLTFSEAVRLTALTIQKDGERKLSLGPLPAETRDDFSVALPAIDDGHFIVSWRALSEDTHVMTGEFMFAVGAEGAQNSHMNHQESTAGEHHATPEGEHHDEHGGAH